MFGLIRWNRHSEIVAAMFVLLFGVTAPDARALGIASADEQATEFPKSLVGQWRSEPYRMRLATDLEKSIWGADSASHRAAELTIQPSGEATLTVTRAVVSADGQMLPASTSIEEARLKLGGVQQKTATKTEYAVTVISAERRYPDDPDYRWPLEGLRVRVMEFNDEDAVEIRFEPREGRGSFWETLRREGGSASGRAVR
jgi:hypothetical protein